MIGLLLFLVLVAFGGELKYCVQVAADKNLETIKKYYKSIKDFPEARIEKRGDLFLLRVGAEIKKENLSIMYQRIKSLYPDAYIKKCEIDSKYVVFPMKPEEKETKALTKEKESGEDIKQLKEFLLSIKSEIKTLKDEITEIKKIPKEKPKEIVNKFNSDLSEKILYGVLGFLVSSFILTWFILLMLYKKVRAANVENANLLNDLFRLIKILNLLSRGNIVKMENGKLMIYDSKRERWREVE